MLDYLGITIAQVPPLLFMIGSVLYFIGSFILFRS